MASSSDDVPESVAGLQEVNEANENLDAEDEKRIQEKVEALRQRGEPVNILVIGPTGSGKSSLINALMGDTLARVKHGAAACQTELELHHGNYEGIEITVYDTVGFSDTKGKSENNIVKEIAKNNKFDLILICTRMDCRADDKVKQMFTVLCDNISKQMWKRTVIVLTFANMFLQLGNIRKLQTTEAKAESMKREIEEFRSHVHQYVQGSITGEMFSAIPFCVAGLEDDRESIAGTNDWLVDLWRNCISRSSDEARNFLKRLAEYRLVVEISAVGGGALTGGVVGGAIGGVVGTVVPVAGTIAGAGVGAGVGAGMGAVITAALLALKRRFKRHS